MVKQQEQLQQEQVRHSEAEQGDSFGLSDDRKASKPPSYGAVHDGDEHDNSIAWREAVDRYKTTETGVSFENDLKGNNEFGFLDGLHRRRLSTSNSSNNPYVSLFGHTEAAKYIVNAAGAFLVFFTLLILFGPFLVTEFLHRSQWCPIFKNQEFYLNATVAQGLYDNPDHDSDPCRYERLPHLFYLTLEEADLCRRMLLAVIMGAAIGYERRSADRPAGIRTMGLVSLGSCFFTISSQLAFKSSTMGWDASRVTAAIPSGCGFLGAGLIWKGLVGKGKEERHEVHGLTTAAGVWLSAAIGTGCGGKLYFVSIYSCILVTMILKYGPEIHIQKDENYNQGQDNLDDDDDDNDDFDFTNDDVTPLHQVGGSRLDSSYAHGAK